MFEIYWTNKCHRLVYHLYSSKALLTENCPFHLRSQNKYLDLQNYFRISRILEIQIESSRCPSFPCFVCPRRLERKEYIARVSTDTIACELIMCLTRLSLSYKKVHFIQKCSTTFRSVCFCSKKQCFFENAYSFLRDLDSESWIVS